MDTPRQLTAPEETARCVQMEVDTLLDELSYVPPLEIARELIDNPGDMEASYARMVARAIRERVAGQGVMRTRLEPPSVKKPAPSTPKAVVARKPKAAEPGSLL